jgi:hypothetical protein
VIGVGAGPTVYFAARGVLDAGAVAGEDNLYAVRGNTTKFITVLGQNAIENASTDEMQKQGRVSPNGRYVLFASWVPQLGFDNNGRRQFYRYDFDTDSLQCVSCNPSGQAPTQDANLLQVTGLLDVLLLNERRNLLDNGTVFFISPDALVAADTNQKYDVYEWNGEPKLISSGRSNVDSEFLGASLSGNDVFFLTREQLVGSDKDSDIDAYDARVGGGFPEQQTPPACQGDACKGPVSAPPDATNAGTAFFTDSGTKEATGNLTFRVGSIKSAAKKKLAKTGKITISVRVSDAAAIDAQMSARIGKSTRVVDTANVGAARAGTVKLTLVLTKAARKELRKKKQLRVTITVKVLDAGSKRATMTLRRAK